MKQGRHIADHKVVVGICTYKRPKMLKDCLESLITQKGIYDLCVMVVVVDNDPLPNFTESIVKRVNAVSSFPFQYVKEPRRGIAIARNSVLDKALEIGADWIVFIDDDETAAPDWLANMMATEYRQVPVLEGRVIYVLPNPTPFWAQPNISKLSEGQPRKTAATNNVRFSADIIRGGLRFNTSLGFMGGEDVEFLTEARRRGFFIRHTRKAITFETAHPERLTFRGQIYQKFWFTISDQRQYVINRGRFAATTRKLHSIPAGLLQGTILLLFSPCAIVAGVQGFKWCALFGGRKIAKALGLAAGMIGYLPQPYKNVVGE